MSVKVFGDSFSATHKYPYFNDHWSTIVGRTIGEEVINYGRIGATNQYILNSISKNIPNLSEDDYVFIQISGQGRIPVIGVPHLSFFPDESYFLDVSNDKKHQLTKTERKIIMELYCRFFLKDGAITQGEIVNTIIELANFISTKVKKVVLWNLTPLSGLTDIHYDQIKFQNIEITHSDLWTESSCGGNKGWIDVMIENNVTFSEFDPHPHPIKGNKLIAKEFLSGIVKTSLI
jgi:hypothetical protein